MMFCIQVFCLALLALQSACAGDLQEDVILLSEDFDHGVQDGFAKKLLSHPRVRLAEGAGPDGTDAVRVAYVGFEKGSQRVVVRYPLRARVDQATLCYDVCFDKGFQWTLGGKLHGLGPKHPITGGEERLPDGWSARVVFKNDGRCSTYLYDQNKKLKYGTGDTTEKPVFTAGSWHHVVMQIGLNTPAKSNGFARILIDGKEVLSTTQVCFRGEGGTHTQIQQFLFSTFHGGNDSRWTPVDKQGKPTTVYALFDNFQVTQGIP